MALTGNKIEPERYYVRETDQNTFQRPAIDLPDLYAQGGAVNMRDGGDPEREFIEQMREGFSVYNKPTYGSEIPGTPTIDQQRYALSQQGQREAENRARVQKDSLTAVDPSGTLGVTDVLSTIGKGIAAIPVHAARQAMHWLQGGKQKDAPTGKDYEAWMQPKTQEGAEFLETLGEIPEKITGSTMGFGMHPNLWASGLGTPSVSQMRAGLKLGAERAAPVIGKIDQAVRTGYESGAIPQPGMSIKDVTPRVLAPANEQGFYSPTEAAALNLQRKSGSGQAFLNDLLKQENVRPDEINAMGLDTFLKGKKDVTAAEVQDYIANNKIQLGEARYGDPTVVYKKNADLKSRIDDVAAKHGLREVDYGEFHDAYDERATNLPDDLRELLKERAANRNLSAPTAKFIDYQLPGGENYREVVITLPQNKVAVFPKQAELEALESRLAQLKAEGNREEYGSLIGAQTDLRNERNKFLQTEQYRLDQEANKNRYQSSHWDEPNALAHLRMSDRVTDGKKTLLVDEVQSDWHQAGREQGYKGGDVELAKGYKWDQSAQSTLGITENDPAWIATDRNGNLLGHYTSEKAAKAALSERTGGVPDAPFKDDWYQLALKRAVKEAIDGGYDRVALPTGARVAERFDLSKQIESISHQKNPDGTYKIVAVDKNNRHAMNESSVPQEKLSSIVGKDVAQKIINAEGTPFPEGTVGAGMTKLSGLDLQVGGEGMKKYYDEIYPGYLKKFGKKYGASVGKTTVDADGVAEPLHYMEITPAMREAFKTGIHMKRGGKVQFANNIDAMRLALSKG